MRIVHWEGFLKRAKASCESGGGEEEMLEKIHRIAHDCFRFDGPVTIYTDPYKVPDKQPKADLVLISHEHFDHCSSEDLAKIVKEDTVIVACESCKGKVSGNVRFVKPGQRLEVKGVNIETVPAYNTNKNFHPKNAGHVGYLFTLEGQKIYFAGDTDQIPEMKNITCDIALLPVSGTYVMTVDEAVAAAKDLKPKVVIPMHYGAIVGSENDPLDFRNKFKGETAIK
jgi:L-ascorbate metabolism protein UlaG (beta-lactamase superfamily)